MRRLEAAGAYVLFIENAAHFLPVLERAGLSLIFTLYPGGGFVVAIRDRFHYYGSQPTDFLPGFYYSRMDAIVSPNVPFVLRRSAFDGFPTGACIEAGTCGLPVVCTDEFDLNVAFRLGYELGS